MSVDDAITHWINGLYNGDANASQYLWDKYFSRLCRLARQRLPSNARTDFDEEDVALSALDCLYRGIEAGNFPDVQDRGNLWSLLILITSRKISHRLRDRSAQKRGGNVNKIGIDVGEIEGISNVLVNELTPDFIAEMKEEMESLMLRLPNENIRRIAELKVAGYSNSEIAKDMECGKRTVERRLMIIRQTWIENRLKKEDSQNDPI